MNNDGRMEDELSTSSQESSRRWSSTSLRRRRAGSWDDGSDFDDRLISSVGLRTSSDESWSRDVKWITTRFCQWPQTLSLQLEQTTRVFRISLRTSGVCVPTSIEVLVDEHHPNSVKTLALNTFRSIGSVNFDISQHISHIHLEAPVCTRFLRLIVAGVHPHYQNTYNQCRIERLEVFGDLPPNASVRTGQKQFHHTIFGASTSPQAAARPNDLRAKVDAILSQVGIFPAEALAASRPSNAFRKLMSMSEHSLQALQQRRRHCQERDLQEEVDRLHSIGSELASISTEAQQVEQARRLAVAMDDFDNGNSQKARLDELLQLVEDIVTDISRSDPQRLQRQAPKEEEQRPPQLDEQHAFGESMVLTDLLDIDLHDDDEDDENMPDSDATISVDRALTDPLLEIYGTSAVNALLSRSWRSRRLAVRRVHAMSSASGGATSSSLMSEALSRVVLVALLQESLGLRPALLDLVPVLIESVALANPPRHQRVELLLPSLRFMLRCCSDGRTVVREAASALLVSSVACLGASDVVLDVILESELEPDPAQNWRPLLAQLYALKEILQRFGVRKPDENDDLAVSLPKLMQFVVECLRHSKQAVRSAAIAIVKLVGDAADEYLYDIDSLGAAKALASIGERAAVETPDSVAVEPAEKTQNGTAENVGTKLPQLIKVSMKVRDRSPEKIVSLMWSM